MTFGIKGQKIIFMSEKPPQKRSEGSEKSRRKELKDLVKKGAFGTGKTGKETASASPKYYKEFSKDEITFLNVMLAKMALPERQETLATLKDEISPEEYERLFGEQKSETASEAKVTEPAAVETDGEKGLPTKDEATEETSVPRSRLALPEKRFPTEVEGRVSRAANLILKAPTQEDADRLFGIFSKLHLITAEEYEELQAMREMPPQGKVHIAGAEGVEGPAEGAPTDAQVEEEPVSEEKLREYVEVRQALKTAAETVLDKKIAAVELVLQSKDVDDALLQTLMYGNLDPGDPDMKEALESRDTKDFLTSFVGALRNQKTSLFELVSSEVNPEMVFTKMIEDEDLFLSLGEQKPILDAIAKAKVDVIIKELRGEATAVGPLTKFLQEKRAVREEEFRKLRATTRFLRDRKKPKRVPFGQTAEGVKRGRRDMSGFSERSVDEEAAARESLEVRKFIVDLFEHPEKFEELSKTFSPTRIEEFKKLVEEYKKEQDLVRKIGEVWDGVQGRAGLKEKLSQASSATAKEGKPELEEDLAADIGNFLALLRERRSLEEKTEVVEGGRQKVEYEFERLPSDEFANFLPPRKQKLLKQAWLKAVREKKEAEKELVGRTISPQDRRLLMEFQKNTVGELIGAIDVKINTQTLLFGLGGVNPGLYEARARIERLGKQAEKKPFLPEFLKSTLRNEKRYIDSLRKVSETGS